MKTSLGLCARISGGPAIRPPSKKVPALLSALLYLTPIGCAAGCTSAQLIGTHETYRLANRGITAYEKRHFRSSCERYRILDVEVAANPNPALHKEIWHIEGDCTADHYAVLFFGPPSRPTVQVMPVR